MGFGDSQCYDIPINNSGNGYRNKKKEDKL